MCGICGIVASAYSRSEKQVLLEKMLAKLEHRGPDEQGLYVDENVAIGARRLSIVDIKRGTQPVFNETGSLVMVFNGEIYNSIELAQQLSRQGHRLITRSDAEPIVHCYEEKGTDSFCDLNGMFAFCLWDKERKRLIIARDHFGIKPLYYYHEGGVLAFASEIKALLELPFVPRELNRRALDLYLTLEYIPQPLSIFRDIHKLPPATALHFEKSGSLTMREYWCLEDSIRLNGEISEEAACEELRMRLEDSVRLRLRSDVDIGVFLSGGIDSSSIIAFMKKHNVGPVRAFSIAFHEKTFDESVYAREIEKSFAIQHYQEFFTPQSFLDIFPAVVEQLDEPFADPSVFPTFYLSRIARQHVKAAFSGEGGDELFAGYPTYWAGRFAGTCAMIPGPLRKMAEKAAQLFPPSDTDLSFFYKYKRFMKGIAYEDAYRPFIWKGAFSEDEKRLLSGEGLKGSFDGLSLSHFDGIIERYRNFDVVSRHQLLDIATYLQDDLLVKADRASMKNSLEVRLPFLDYRLAEFVFSLPSFFRLKGFTGKYILKRALKDTLPQSVLRRKKKGFGMPVARWLSNELRSLLMDTLSPSLMATDGFFKQSYIDALLQRHLTKKEDLRKEIWVVLMAELWYRRYMRS
ncbi:MAG: asparagine synthase (glutamine-hydrolyzing) [Candidatus Omnitrophica bacterium]|nr:asparagine synthase (glutamine-hydrolyzing) [Candidatus Omnitrophota bacterium]